MPAASKSNRNGFASSSLRPLMLTKSLPPSRPQSPVSCSGNRLDHQRPLPRYGDPGWRRSLKDRIHFVVRSLVDDHCLGLVGLHAAKTAWPEIGIWIREDVHGNGIGREAVAAVVAWASEELDPDGFEYPVAEENMASRRIAEGLGGSIVETRSNPKYTSVVYRLPNPRR
ncbi:GNAT family N-acetyltransferase [Mesorhizobium sp. 2RAF45]|uniref:GNAT family N-acetyltransferase n=1 Tax=Mesorhizobium sp. 2RAF45 TaxID=3233001 RepID=UPI003F98EC3D